MTALAWRQIVAASRLPAVWIATAFHVAALSLYILVWGTGIPLAGARSAFDQFASAQSLLLLVVLPWVAARCLATLDRDAVVRLAVLSARPPSTVVMGACIGLVGVVCAVAVTGLPLAVLAHQISERSAQELAGGQLRVVALGACASTLTLAGVFMSGHRMSGWLLGTLATGVVVAVTPQGVGGGLTLAAVAAGAAAALAQRTQQAWQYQTERRA